MKTMHKDNEVVVVCRELSEFELKTVDAFFMRDNVESLHLFHSQKIFLVDVFWSPKVWFPKADKFIADGDLLHSFVGPLFIRRLKYYFPTRQSCFELDNLEPLSHNSDVEGRGTAAYLSRYSWSGCFRMDSVFSRLVSICMEDSNNTFLKLCSVDSLFSWAKRSGEDLYSRLFLFLNYVIPGLFIRQPTVIRYFILKHLLLLVDIFIIQSSNRQPLSLHHSFVMLSLKACNDPCCLIRQLGLELLQKLLFRPCFRIILYAFLRKNISPNIISSFCNATLIPSHWDTLYSFLQTVNGYYHSKGFIALELAGSLIQLGEDSCLHIRVSLVRVLDLVLYQVTSDKTLARHITDCLCSLLYDSNNLTRIEALNVLIKHARNFCVSNVSLGKLLVCLLDPDSMFRYSVAFFLSKVILTQDCNLDSIFKYYLKAFEFFHDDLPILVWSIERLGVQNVHLVRKNVLKFPQLVSSYFSKKWKVIDQLERNILYIDEQPKLLLIFKFFLSSNDEQVLDRLPRAFLLLFDSHVRKREESRLYLQQQHSRNGNTHFANISSPLIISCLSFDLAFFGYRCLHDGYSCFESKYQSLVLLYIQSLDHMSCTVTSSVQPITQTAKCLLEWLRCWPTQNYCCDRSKDDDEEKNNLSETSCKANRQSALLDTIILLELFQNPYKEIEQLCIVLKDIYEAVSFSHLARDFYRAVEHYFIYSNSHLRTNRYYLKIISLKHCVQMQTLHKKFIELLCGIRVQNLDRIPTLYIRIYSNKDANIPLTNLQRLENCEQQLKQGRTLVSETCQLFFEADVSVCEGFVSLETLLYNRIVFLAPLQPINW